MDIKNLESMLYRYMQGAVRVYGIIPVNTLWEIFSWQCHEMTLEDFYSLVKRTEVFCGGVDLVTIGDLLGTDEENPYEDVIADSCLVQTTWDHYFDMCMSHEDLPVRVFSQEEILSYADETYAPKTAENLALADYLQGRSPYYDGWRLAIEATHQARLDTPAKDCMFELQRMGAVFYDLEDRLLFANLYRQVFDTTPKQIHNGHTEQELHSFPLGDMRKKQRIVAWFCAPSGKDRFMPEDVNQMLQDASCRPESARTKWWQECYWGSELPQGLLEPCACGSGLSFEDCCAKR